MNPELVPVRNVPANEAAICFIHGFGGNIRDTWQKFPEFLGNEASLKNWDIWLIGYPTRLRIDLVSLWSGDPDLDKVALRFRTDARNSELKRYKSICLIAHSMGGLVTQCALLADKALRDRASYVFLFGTPSGGLRKASLARFLKPQMRNMSHDGEFIRKLRVDWNKLFSVSAGRKLPFRFIATAGENDEFVPGESAVGAFPPEEYPDAIASVSGNHLQIVKPDAADHPSVLLVVNAIRGDAAPLGEWNAARVAVERNDFKAAIEALDPNRDDLDPEARVQLALALESVGRQEDAIDVLSRGGGTSTEVMGTLAGRLKRRWLASRRAPDAERARNLYRQAFDLAAQAAKPDHAQAYWNGINVAFFHAAYSRDDDAVREMVTEVLAHCAAAAAGVEKPTEKMWRLATEGEAQLLLGDQKTALRRYASALRCKPEPRQIASMYQQALYLARVFEDNDLAKALKSLFREGEA